MDVAETLEPRRPSALVNIDSGTSQYSNEQRREAVRIYMETGKGTVVAKRLGMDPSTICLWRQTEWWDDLAHEISIEIDDEVRALLRSTMVDGQKTVLAKLDTASAKDAAIIASIAIDKLRLIDGKPSRITGDTRIDNLASQLATLSNQVNAKLVSDQ